MKSVWLILVFLGLGCILLSQAGCEEAQKSAAKSEPVVRAAEEPAEQAAAPQKPVPPKPEPAAQQSKPAEKNVAAQADPNAPAPRIRFDKLVHNFGDIDPASNNICEFGFKNVGDALLKILNVKPDCGCTLFTLEPKEYKPGESGVLKIKYHAVSRAGPITRHVEVFTNDPVTPQVSLTMKGRVVERVSYLPKRLNLLLKDDDEALPEVTLTSLDDKPFSVQGIKSSVNAITAEIDPSVEATKFVLKLKANKEQLRRLTNGVVEISLTHPGCKSVTIPFSALSRFVINPPVIILFDAEPGKAVVRDDITVLNNYEEEFEIESVKSQTGITKVVKQEKIRNGYTFDLEITPPEGGESRRFNDEFSVQVKDGDLLKIKCQGFYSNKK
ncbi:MAG: DUF1573 domain-containing protein [Sedimentisphaerales bacterium]|nr:DUF1573 domain-containing protein [Sedimentisphaerales bacterium]